MLKNLIMLFSFLLPWSARRRLLEKQFGYSIHPNSRIGLAWICPRRLIMEEHSSIGHLNLCKNIDLLHVGAHAIIGQLNWITGFPKTNSRHFAHQIDRQPELILEAHAGISSRHLIDCTARVRIGAFATVAGTSAASANGVARSNATRTRTIIAGRTFPRSPTPRRPAPRIVRRRPRRAA